MVEERKVMELKTTLQSKRLDHHKKLILFRQEVERERREVVYEKKQMDEKETRKSAEVGTGS